MFLLEEFLGLIQILQHFAKLTLESNNFYM